MLDLKKLALLGITGGLLLAASDHNTIYAGEHEDSGEPEKEANGCDGKDGCPGEDEDKGHDSDDE